MLLLQLNFNIWVPNTPTIGRKFHKFVGKHNITNASKLGGLVLEVFCEWCTYGSRGQHKPLTKQCSPPKPEDTTTPGINNPHLLTFNSEALDIISIWWSPDIVHKITHCLATYNNRLHSSKNMYVKSRVGLVYRSMPSMNTSTSLVWEGKTHTRNRPVHVQKPIPDQHW
jgi:hypothetical protein